VSSCDPWREFNDPAIPSDKHNGCALIFVSDPGEEHGIKHLPVEQQDTFQNTQHYHSAKSLHGSGYAGETLPGAPQDIEPTCYIAEIAGQKFLGYEEAAGDVLLPCPNTHGLDYSDPNVDLSQACYDCYKTRCEGKSNERWCGGLAEGGVKVGQGPAGETATFVKEATTAYHCHLTMAEDGACDYVQRKVLEQGRGYEMDYGVLCGWDHVRDLNLTFCDCTANSHREGRCERDQCLKMAFQGTVCKNCGGCHHWRAYESIFYSKPEPDQLRGWNEYRGWCAAVRTATTEAGRNYAKMMCSQGLFCRGDSVSGSACEYHCSLFGEGTTMTPDPKCLPQTPSPTGNRRLLEEAKANIDISKGISNNHISALHHPIKPRNRAHKK